MPIGVVRADPDLRATLEAAMRSSMLNDLESGFRLEVPWLSGAVARMARESGLEAPVHATLHAVLKPQAGGSTA